MILTIGAASKILAAGISPAVTVGTTTFNAEGATPNVHISSAPSVNCIPIGDLPFFSIERAYPLRLSED
jgi:hypothetical protein